MPGFNKLHALAASIPERGQQLLDAYQMYWVSAAAQLAPVASMETSGYVGGHLKGSVQPAPGDGPDSRRVTVGANYGIYQEFGTMDMPAQPFLRPARAALVDPWKRDLKAILKP